MGDTMNANDRKIQALRLIRSSSGGGLTHHANVLISRQALLLLSEGFIAYPSARLAGQAYVLTAQGIHTLARHCDVPGCFQPRPCAVEGHNQ